MQRPVRSTPTRTPSASVLALAPPVPTARTSRELVRLARRAALGVCLLGLTGCATSRWVDDHTSGDLWGTGGREMGLLTWLRDVSEEPASADESARDEALLDAMIELVLIGVAIR